MALIPNPRPEKYGGVLLDENHAVTAFTRRGSPGSSWHFIGPQVVEASAFEDLEDGVPRESVMEVYPRLMAIRRGAVMGFTGQFSFQDIGTPADLLRTSLEFAAAAGRPDHPKWGHHVRVGASARVTKSELWNDVTVGEHAVLDECVVADGVTIPDGARYERSAIVQTAAGLVVEPLR
jgi:NDP-sugar pyrophosphorylase family protein